MAEHTRKIGAAVASMEQRTLETIERSRVLLEASGQRLDRQEAAVKCAHAQGQRQQADIDRASAEAARDLAAQLPDPSRPAQRSEKLRKQALTAIEAFALNLEETARTYEQLAASVPERRDENRQSAARARRNARRARRAREILRTFPD